MIWKEWYELGFGNVVAHTYEEMKEKLRNQLINSCDKNDFSSIDPFGDGKAQERICDYITEINKKLHKGNVIALEAANTNYRLKYGQDKVISNQIIGNIISENVE